MNLFLRCLIVVVLVSFTNPSGAWIRGKAAHNGGRSQINMGLLGLNEIPFINMTKAMPNPTNAGLPIDPATLDVNGWVTSGAWLSTISLPGKGGNILVRWDGNCIYNAAAGSVVSGSTTPTLGGDGIYHGRYVYTPSTSSVRAGCTAQGTLPGGLLAYANKMEVMWADEEALFDAGEIFSPKTIDLVGSYLRAGTVRFLNWQGGSSGANTSNVTTWESLKSDTYWSYAADEYRNVAATGKPKLYAGATTNSGDDYSVTLGSGGPVDKQMIQLKWNASASASSTTSLGALSTAFPGAVSSDIVVHWVAHGLPVGAPVGFIGSTGTPLPGPMGSGINYYVSNVIDADNFNISLTSGGSNLVKTSSGTAGSTINAIRMPTLNLNGTGAVPVRTQPGDPGGQFGDTQPTINRYSTLVYDAEMASWLHWLGSSGGTGGGIINGVPASIILAFCTKVRAHCWMVTPFMATDPMTNYASSAANYFRANKPSWMKFYLEGVNETWNSALGFYGTRYGWNKAFIHWGGSAFDSNNWYGKIISTIGQDVQAAFSGNTAHYGVMLGVQASTGDAPTTNDTRLNSTAYVTQVAAPQSGYLKEPAYKYATHGAPAMYFQSAWYGFPPELSAAYDYAVNGNATALQNYVDASTSDTGSSTTRSNQNLVNMGTRYANFGSYFSGPWGGSFVLGMQAYEGGPNAIAPTSTNNSSGISGATKDAGGCVLTLATTFVNGNQNGSAASNSPTPAAMVGMTLSISGVVGMTQLNGNTYTVSEINVGADPTKVRINVDSSGFSTYTSGGTAVYVSGNTWLTTLRAAYRLNASMQTLTYGGSTSNYQKWLDAGGIFPSHFDYSAASSPWGAYQPDQYTATPSPLVIGIHNFNFP